MALFYVLPHHCERRKDADFANRFLSEFLEGYAPENTLDVAWLKQIPYFLKLREIDVYIAIHRGFDLDDLDPWCTSFMRDRKYKIEDDVPYVDMDW